MKRILYYILPALLLIAPGIGQAQQAQKIKTFFSRLEKRNGFSGGVLVAEGGRVIYQGAFGYADFNRRSVNRLNTAFPIASMSKTLTATAIMELVEQGKFSVADPVAQYLNGFPYPEVRIGHLLSHTSGLPPYNAFFKPILDKEPGRIFTNDDFLAAAAANRPPLIYQPGTKGNYDNVNYLILSLLIEKISGERYPDYIYRHILQPAGMTHTRFMPLSAQFNTDTLRNFSYPHLFPRMFDEFPVRSNTISYVRDYWRTFAVTGFGDYISTLDDQLKYDLALYDGRLLRPATLKQMFEPVRLNDGTVNPQLFGLGWEIEPDSSHGKIVFHSGAATGLSSVIIRNIDKHQTIILFDNDHYNAHETGSLVLKLLNGASIELPKTSIARSYGIMLQKRGAEKARQLLIKLCKDTANYHLSESELNQLGYDFAGSSNSYHLPEWHFYAQALATLQLNTELFPHSWNAFDSYGETLAKAGRFKEAAAMYEHSIRLNPKNEAGKKALEMIRRE